ncbi:DNA cytosine methyltransferase [Psychrobacter sp.]|uniref:DNA cytosine methyltransferase n=1 Tax=Psychrobacter sp. TaxID=56811 RepID=UPI003F9A5F54
MGQLLPHELIIDNFAGGGGTSTGLEAAFGRPVDIAINHDPEAIAMHRINHPDTEHLCESVWEVDPIEVTKNQPVGVVWLSPDCKHFSKAKGSVPVDKRIRGLAWVALRWAAKCRPRIIMLENVEEFKTWGPIGADGRPCKDRKGQTFKSFLRALRRQGYAVEYKELRACDYGTPTIRKRFFLIARRDGLPIVWPKATHGDPESKEVEKGKLLPFRTAAECIDWSIPTPSIFDTEAQIKEKYGIRAVRPLADNTCKRIAAGVMRYVVNNASPFIVKSNHTASYYNCFRGQQLSEPLQTVTQVPGFALVTPYVTKLKGTNLGHGVSDPVHTITAGGNHFGLVAPLLVKFRFNSQGVDITNPMPTITAGSFIKRPGGAGHALGICAPVLTECANTSSPRCMPANEPLRTICAQIKGGHHALIAPFIAKNYTGVVGSDITEPLHTVTATDHNSLVSAFLTAYYGNEKNGQSVKDPIRTIVSKERFGLVKVEGVDYQIVDIGFRMLQPRELFRAQGFGDDYIIDKGIDEHGKTIKLTKTAQTRMVGNSVCPPLAQALVMANFKHELNYSEKIA